MRAAILEQGRFRTGTIADPVPGQGQVLVRSLVCGVCGSDLHARSHAHTLSQAMGEAGFRAFMNPDLPVVMGHEFVGEIIDFGPGCKKTLGKGQRVIGLPFVFGPRGIELVGFSNSCNGGMAEAMVLLEDLLFATPDHVATDVAALTEPLAVAVHAVEAAAASGECAFAVHGCGPVGLFVIARLRHLGLGPILAIDPDANRRRCAEQLGADSVIAPDHETIARWWQQQGASLGMSDAAVTTSTIRPVAFECVGKPGLLQAVAAVSPMRTAVIVVGVCMEDDAIRPSSLLMKEMSLRFVFGYSHADFSAAAQMIASDPDRLAFLVTGSATLDEVSDAFDSLAGGGRHVKILIRP